MRCLTNAAAGLPPALHERLRRVFPNAELFRMYGQTECIRVCYLDPGLIDEKPTSVGKAIPGHRGVRGRRRRTRSSSRARSESCTSAART